jgi:hypothetical protein
MLLPSHLNLALLLLLLLLLPSYWVPCQQHQLSCSHRVEVAPMCCLLLNAYLPPLLSWQLPWQHLRETPHALLLLLLQGCLHCAPASPASQLPPQPPVEALH